MTEDNGSGKVAWFIAGAALGASIALLYAPASGKYTRRRIGRTLDEQRDRLAESGRDVFDRGKDLIEKGRRVADQASDVLESGRKLVQG